MAELGPATDALFATHGTGIGKGSRGRPDHRRHDEPQPQAEPDRLRFETAQDPPGSQTSFRAHHPILHLERTPVIRATPAQVPLTAADKTASAAASMVSFRVVHRDHSQPPGGDSSEPETAAGETPLPPLTVPPRRARPRLLDMRRSRQRSGPAAHRRRYRRRR